MNDRAGDMQETKVSIYVVLGSVYFFLLKSVNGDISNTPLVPRFGS